jgi:hypothetical protein
LATACTGRVAPAVRRKSRTAPRLWLHSGTNSAAAQHTAARTLPLQLDAKVAEERDAWVDAIQHQVCAY